ncbi:MAG: hypothetical protein HQ591_08350 [candidate division Zixibacteria bacterium]|nr:hypothetical protein [Candidatus Tariuqbacter arcticus]
MRKGFALIVVVMFLFSAGAVYAQNSLSYIQIGSFNPKAADSGLIIGFGTAKMVDERVELGISLDIFTKQRTDEERISWEDPVTNVVIDTVITNFESTIYMFPIMAYACVNFPVEFPITPYVSGSIGYTLLWNSYDNYVSGAGETNYYGGFGYRFAVGGMYPLGSKSAFIAELFYNSSKPSHSEETAIGLPTRTEVDMSGLGICLGLKFGGFGIF